MRSSTTTQIAPGKFSGIKAVALIFALCITNLLEAQPPCTGLPQAGNTIAFQNPVCPGATFVVLMNPVPNLSGISLQWFSSTDGTNYAPIPGANQQQVVTSETVPTSFTCRVRCNNSGQSSFSQPLLINLIQPTITYPSANVQLNNGESTLPDNTGYVTFSTPCCSGSVTYSDVTSSNCCQLVITRTWTITDCAGEGTQFIQTITVLLDVSAPVITCSTLAPGACNTTPSPNYASVTVSDECPAELTVTSSDAVGAGNCEVVTTFTWTATDLCGHSATCTQTYSRIMDAGPPVITCPAPSALPCNTTPTPSPTTITATDNCGTPEITLVSSGSSTSGCLVTFVFTWRATDNCGNFSECNQIFTSIHDNVAPVITCPGPTTLPCHTVPTPSPALITATDNCGTPVISLLGTSSSTVGCLTTYIFSWRATDACGNFSDCDQVINVPSDIIPPMISCPGPISLPCNTTPLPNASLISASDNCGLPDITLIGTNLSTVGCVTTFTFTWKATDACGNFAVCDQSLSSVFDVTDPVITCPAAVTLDCNTFPNPSASMITATDDCGTPAITLETTDIEPIGCLIKFDYTWKATDDCGNYSECDQLYFSVFDFEPPVIICPAPDTLCNVTPTPSPTLISATDNCSPAVISLVGTTTSTAGCVTTYNFTWKATDHCGNFSTCVQVIYVINDQIDPVITGCPNSMSVPTEDGLCGAHVTWTPPIATDNCGLLSFINDFVPGGFYPVGNTTVTYTATDLCGHVTICQFVISVYDWEPPWNMNCPGVIIKDNDPGLCTAVVTWNVTATDNCGINSIVSVPASGSVFPVGVTPVLVTATDVNGNTWTCTFNVHVNDTEKPVFLNCPGNVNANTTLGLCTSNLLLPNINVTDNCGIQSIVTAPFLLLYPVGITPMTVTATDIHGNVSKCMFDVIVTDDQLPNINNCPANIRVDNDPTQCKAEVTWVEPTATDNCGILSFVSDHDPGDDFPVGTTPVTYTATDIHGNIKICNFSVRVDDNEDPFILSHDIVTCDSVVYFDFIIGDNCGIDEYSYTPPSGSTFTPGTTTLVYVEAWDIHGNFSYKYFNVTVLLPPSKVDTVIASSSQVCLGDSVTLTAYFDTLGSGDQIKLFRDNCNLANVLDSSATVDNSWSVKVKPSSLGVTTYYVRIEGICDSTQCKAVTVEVISCPNAVTLNLKLYLQGFYSGNGLMNNAGLGGCLYINGVPGSVYDDVDSITVSAMESTLPYSEVEARNTILQIDGSASVTFAPPVTIGTYYYIRVHHRNSIPTWSKNPVLFLAQTNYDFTIASLQAYDDGFSIPMKRVDSNPDRWAFYGGDINGDGTVNSLDMTLEETNSNLAVFGYFASDLNGDGSSNSLDMTIIENNSNLGVFELSP